MPCACGYGPDSSIEYWEDYVHTSRFCWTKVHDDQMRARHIQIEAGEDMMPYMVEEVEEWIRNGGKL